MRKLLLAAALVILPSVAFAQYYGGGGYGGGGYGYSYPRYHTYCHYERYYVSDYYGGHYERRRVCEQVAY